MKQISILLGLVFLIVISCSSTKQDNVLNEKENLRTENAIIKDTLKNPNWNKLSDEEAYVILEKGTERPYSGKFVDNKTKGTYLCKQCDTPLFESSSKFDSRTGWPSFDAYIGSSVEEVLDADGYRSEIICANCKGHLGHVFFNEGFTDKNTRHCVNSVSLSFDPAEL